MAGQWYERVADVACNRAAEGIRVIEDYARFQLEDSILCDRLRIARHGIRDVARKAFPDRIIARNVAADPGITVSMAAGERLDGRKTDEDLIRANFARAQEALRSIEECVRLAGFYSLSKDAESVRFDLYKLESDLDGRARKNLPTEGLYGFITEEFSRGRSAAETAEALGRAGVAIIQYREKEKTRKQKLEECGVVREITRRHGQCFIVNDDIDIALLVGADGVHLGQDDIPAREARALIGSRMILGISTHAPEQLAAAIHDGADYVGVGPIFPTKTKKNVCDAVGLEYLDHALKNSTIPCVAIGGIKRAHVATLTARGARIIAMVTEILDSEAPETVAREVVEMIEKGEKA